MKVIDTLPDFPSKEPTLRGLNLEAYTLLQKVDKSRPVLKINPEGQNVAAVKRAFARAAKELGMSVRNQNGDDGTIFVRLDGPTRRAGTTRPKVHPNHSTAAIEAEMKRLNSN